MQGVGASDLILTLGFGLLLFFGLVLFYFSFR